MGKKIKKWMVKEDWKEIRNKIGMRMKEKVENIIRKRMGKKIWDRKEVRGNNRRLGWIWVRRLERSWLKKIGYMKIGNKERGGSKMKKNVEDYMKEDKEYYRKNFLLNVS